MFRWVSKEFQPISLYKVAIDTSFVVPVDILAASIWISKFEIIFFILLTVFPDFITVFQNGSYKRDVYSFKGFAVLDKF